MAWVLLAGSWMMGTTALITVGSVLYNLLAEMVGGIEFTVFEEVPVEIGSSGEYGAPPFREGP